MQDTRTMPAELRRAVTLRNQASRRGYCDACGAKRRLVTIDGQTEVRVAHRAGCPASSAAIFALLRNWEPAA